MIFDDAMKLTLGFEGDESDDPLDHGGHTRHGVTQAAYDAWRRGTGQRRQSVSLMTDAEERQLYLDNYFTPAHCDELPDNLAKLQFDTAVNSGVGRAIKLLREALGLPITTDYDDDIRNAVLTCFEPLVIKNYLKARQNWYDGIIARDPSQVKYANGWTNRLTQLQAALV